MAIACDIVIAAESPRFEAWFIKFGLHPGEGHLWRLAHRAGAQAPAAIVLFDEALDGRRAQDVGLAWHCVPDRWMSCRERFGGRREAPTSTCTS